VEDQNNYQNYRLFDSHKMIDQKGDSPEEEASWEDSLEEGDFQEEEAFWEEEDTQEEEEYHLKDHQEAVGDHHHYQCRKPIKES